MSPPRVTLFVGPFTRLALAINAEVRARRAALARHGVSALPTRAAAPAARALALGEDAPEARRAAFYKAVGSGEHVFLSALSFLGAPSGAVANRDLFPDMARLFLGLSAVPGLRLRLVVAIEPLPSFFASAASAPLARRVKATPWEALYEISWADLVRDIHAAMPETEIVVLTPEAALCRGEAVLAELFGPAAVELDPAALAAAHLSPDGQRMMAEIAAHGAGAEVRRDLGARMGNEMPPQDLEARFGIDPVTATLLEQRFAEDMAAIAATPGIRVL